MPDIPQILKLVQENLGENLTEEEKEGGFITWNPSESELAEIIDSSGIFLSMIGKKLKGYVITMTRDIGLRNPFFSEMLSYAEDMQFDGKYLSEYKYIIFAQVCIGKEFRGGMTFSRLYSTSQSMSKDQGFDVFIGEIADKNKKSLAVHSNYADAGTYKSSNGMVWHVIVGDLRND